MGLPHRNDFQDDYEPKKKVTKKAQPTVQAKMLAEFMVGEKECEYSVWFSTHYKYEKLPDDSEQLNKWMNEHEKLVSYRVETLQKEGFIVHVENENWFTVKGRNFPISISGKPDIVATKDDLVRIEDCKTGRVKPSHEMQVLVYMRLCPYAPETKWYTNNRVIEGSVIYWDNVTEVSHSRIDTGFKSLFRKSLAILSNLEPAWTAPNKWACQYCSISKDYCVDRFEGESDIEPHDLF
jgi:hypothetical protein